MNLESKLKTDLVKELRNYGGYARRLEDRYAIGLLDLTIKLPEYPHLFAEAKVFVHQSFAPTLRQYEEGKQYIEAGGLCCLIGWSKADKKMYVAEWSKAAKKEESFHSDEGTYAEQLAEWLRNRRSMFTHQAIEKSTSRANFPQNIE